MNPLSLMAALGLIAALLNAPLAWAGDGHDHGDDHGGAAAAGPALPRFAATSEHFELVGVLDGTQLTLYLDRADDNAPVTGARIELEVGSATLTAEPHADAYEATLPAPPAPGVVPITATVTVGADIDLLAGELDVHDTAPADEPVVRPWWRTALGGWVGGALALVVLVALVARVALGRSAKRGAAGRRPGEGAVA